METLNPNASLRSTRREAGVVQRVRASLRRAGPAPDVPYVLIGCSGGRDSVVLAHILQQLASTGAIRAGIVHVDHGVREDSREAATMVKSFGEALGMPVYIARLDGNVIDHHPGVGLEEALRRERYRAFSEIAVRTGANLVALAHHQRDQAETVLLHLIRGAGLQGASGMRELTTISVPWWEANSRLLTLWRPLLGEQIGEIYSWHEQHGLPVAEDVTNEDRQFRRNAIRHDVLPELETIFPGATANLARFAKLAAEDNACLESLTHQQLRMNPDGSLDRRIIIDADLALQRRVVRQWIQMSDYDGELTSDRIDAVRALATRNRSGAEVEIGGGWNVVIAGGVLSLRR